LLTRESHGANATVIFVPPPFAADAIMEAADGGLRWWSASRKAFRIGYGARRRISSGKATRLIGPIARNYFAGKMQNRHHAGTHPQRRERWSRIAVRHAHVRSGLAAERLGIGQSTCIGIGGDPIIGTNFVDAVRLFNDDPETHAIVMIGEIGGNAKRPPRLTFASTSRSPWWVLLPARPRRPDAAWDTRSHHFGRLGRRAGQDSRHGSSRHYGLFVTRRNRRKDSKPLMSSERTFSIIKPDAIANRHVGDILAILEKEGFRILALRRTRLSAPEPRAFTP